MTKSTSPAEHQRPSFVGARIPRFEDDRLLTGRGRYIADVRVHGMAEVAIVRSQLPHAKIVTVDSEEARGVAGVIAVITAADLKDVSAVPDFPDWARPVATFPLARERVRYVGAPVAAVVAENRYIAEDAAELVRVELEELPIVSSVADGLVDGAPRLYEDWPDNRIVDHHATNPAADAAFQDLQVIEGSYYMQRHAASPMECRGVVAEYRDGRLTVWTSTQFAHIVRTMLSYVLRLPERDIRVIAPDVGGGFGQKAEIYPEEYVIPWLAIHLGRPMRWIEDRHEHFVSACHARDVRIDLAAAVHEDGRIQALRGTIWQDLGSGEIFPNGFSPAYVAAGALAGPYRIREQKIDIVGVATNKTPNGAYRGFGVPEAVFAMERLVDKIARELCIDPVDLRRRMIIGPEELPFEMASGGQIDSGSHRAAFEAAVELGRGALEDSRIEFASDPSARLGVGFVTYVEGVAPSYFGTTGHWTSQDAADLRFDPDGGVTVAVGIAAYGQGVATMVTTVTAEELGLRLDQVRVVMGDTDMAPYGLGSWGSRGTTVAAGSIQRAARVIREKATKIAAHLLEAAPADLEIEHGAFFVRGSREPSVTWADVARVALIRTLDLPPDTEPGLEAKATYDAPTIDGKPHVDHVPDERGRLNACATYTNASHAAVVKVDIQTGDIKVLRYIVAHDCGRVINPMIVVGQVNGGVAQGIGGTLLEHLDYDQTALPQATTFMAYMLPTASEIPPIVTCHLESPAPHLPFGAKGAGEAGIIGPAPAIAAAVEHALTEFAIPEIAATPITPFDIRRALRAAHVQNVLT